MKSDVNLTTLEPKRATQGNSNVNQATLMDLLDLLIYRGRKFHLQGNNGGLNLFSCIKN